jgi:threonine/homoserine/homoserine lactone efflux protein
VLFFLGVSALVIAIPGQDTALTIRNTLLGHRATGIATAFGVGAGQAAWTLATALGVGAILAASEPAFAALRLAGAAYLVWLSAYAVVVTRARSVFDRRRVRRAVDAVAGTVLVAFGLRLAAERP